jgi:hypothetical protein
MSGVLAALTNLLAGLWKRPPVLAVLVINLIPAVCVLLFGWSALVLLLLYWAENIIIGLVNVARMIVAAANGGPGGVLGAVFVIPFFILHYGFFCAGHGLFVVLVAGGTFTGGDPLAAVRQVWAGRSDYALPLAAIALYHLGDFVRWLRSGAWKQSDLGSQMTGPYNRIIILHLTVLFGAILVIVLGQPAAAVALLAVFKTLFETVSTARRLDKEKTAMADTPAAS